MTTKKQSIEDVYSLCEELNLKCLSTEYINSKSKLTLECYDCKEPFTKTFSDLKYYGKNTCTKCSRKNSDTTLKQETFKKVLERCEELGLTCLSTEYINNTTNMSFECTDCNTPFERNWSVLRDIDSTLCRSCVAKNVVKQWKYTYEKVYELFDSAGCKLISTTYENNKSPLSYVCECGETSKIALSNFLQGQRCKECSIVKGANTRRTDYDEVKKIFENEGCVLISETFTNSNENLDYICSCGNKSSIKLGSFKNGTRCKKCAGVDSPSIEEVADYFAENDCILISKEYINSKQKLDFICACGELSTMTWGKYKTSPYKKCKNCANKLNGKRIRGENHPSYNPDIDDEDRVDRRLSGENKKWRYEVYKRDSYTCQCCLSNNNDLNAHHLDGYNWCKEKRFDVENGITLCTDCHRDFHKNYGYGNNTKNQFNEFLENYKLNKHTINLITG